LKMVVGLGNPGQKYIGTRHNVGFEILEQLGQKHLAPKAKTKFEGNHAQTNIGGQSTLLLWPLTYMNNSGRCVKATADFYKIDATEDILVVCDDLSLPCGKLRARAKGSAGGQKGLADILRVFGTQEIGRLRVGIDQTPPGWDTADYVLGKFNKEQRETVDIAIVAAIAAIEDWLAEGISHCMNQHN